MLTETLEHYLSSLKQQGLYRQRSIHSLEALNFSSNDYLSLANESRIKKAYQQGFERYPVGSGGSMVICGYHPAHQQLERSFAEALNVDNCLLFSSGYAANLSVVRLLAHFKAHVLIDKMAHASIYDGIQASHVAYTRFFHNDLKDLSAKLVDVGPTSVVLTEGIFSMSGQLAPLAELVHATAQNNCSIIVDEAHSMGVIGPRGLGAVAAHQLTTAAVPLRIIPFGKAFAASGAIVAGQALWIDALLQLSRASIYSTAISPAIAYGLSVTLEEIQAADERRQVLQALIQYFHEASQRSPLTWRNSHSPIQQLQLGCPLRALKCAQDLQKRGIKCAAIRQPTVNKQETGLRVILNYHHTPAQIDRLFDVLHTILLPAKEG
jgi:8-amino-7-oxononanoate synthase